MNPTKSLTILVTNLLFSQLQLCQSYSCDFQQASCARACALCQFRMIWADLIASATCDKCFE